MQFSAEHQAAMLAALGESAIVTGGIIQLLPVGQDDHISLLSGDVVSTPPMAIAAAADVASLSLAVGDTITLRGKDWRIDAIEPDDDGFYIVTLGIAPPEPPAEPDEVPA